jgi:hypothetical protein
MECPRCSSDEDIDGGDHHWDDDSTCSCANCGFFGMVADFKSVFLLESSLTSRIDALRDSLGKGEIYEDKYGELSTAAEAEFEAALETLRLSSGAREWRESLKSASF